MNASSTNWSCPSPISSLFASKKPSATSHDGRTLYVSRPSLADVVAIDLGTRQIVWRVRVEGFRSEHMGISPDGTRLLVTKGDRYLQIAVQRPRHGRWATVRVVARQSRAGTVRARLGPLRAPGRYRLVITAIDAAGNRSQRRLVRLRVAG